MVACSRELGSGRPGEKPVLRKPGNVSWRFFLWVEWEGNTITLLGRRLLLHDGRMRVRFGAYQPSHETVLRVTSTLDDVGPAFVPLRGRSLFDASGDGPHVPRR